MAMLWRLPSRNNKALKPAFIPRDLARFERNQVREKVNMNSSVVDVTDIAFVTAKVYQKY